ncbi:MAG: hypothetical protein ABIJ47_07540 [Candidatus Bathyarchaeota archaeon]
MDSGRQSKTRVGDTKKKEYELTVRLDKSLYTYLGFLENSRRIDSKEEAVLAALRIFKKLNMQDWFPYVYRMGQERVMIVAQGIMDDVLSTMSDSKLYSVSSMIARNRKALDVFDHELDLSTQDNWNVILNELENYGWGKFTLKGDEIKVEHLAVPVTFMRGYLDTLFSVKLDASTDEEGLITLTVKPRKK